MTQQTAPNPWAELDEPAAAGAWNDPSSTVGVWDAFNEELAVKPVEPVATGNGQEPAGKTGHADYSMRASEVDVQDLRDPTTLKSLITFAYAGIAKARVNWVDLDEKTQLQILAKSILPYIGCRNWTSKPVKLTAVALLKHISPPAYVAAAATGPAKPKNPPRMTAKERALSGKTKPNLGFDAIPKTLLEKIESDYAVAQAATASHTTGGRREDDDKPPPRLMSWAARAFAEYFNSTGAGRNGGQATVTPKQAGEAIRKDDQSLRKLFTPDGLMTPWVVSKSRKHQVLPVGKPFVRYCHWWRDDLALKPCGNVNQRLTEDLKVVYDLSGRALEDALVIFILTVQRNAQWDATGADNRRDSMEALARMAGSNVRAMEYAQAEAIDRGWMSSYGEGGFSKPAHRRVHYVPLAKTP